MPEQRPSTVKLMASLREAIGRTAGLPTQFQKDILKKAEEDFYHDCWSPIATPIMMLVSDCREAGWPEVGEAAIRGEFDATAEEFSEWRQAPEGQAVMSQLVQRFRKEKG